MRLLLVEDSLKLASWLGKALSQHGFTVDAVHDGGQADALLCSETYDAVVLDLSLPTMDGLTVLQRLRERGTASPVVVLTARGDLEDRVKGLNLGADDYLAKPFNPRELLARINAVLRRQAVAHTASAINGATVLGFQGWRIDLRLRELRNPAGARVAMTSAEFDLLRIFCERPGRVLSRDSLLDLTQGRNAGSFERSIDVLVSRIRRKIEPDPQDATMIKTVRSGGYMFTPTVDAVAPATNG